MKLSEIRNLDFQNIGGWSSGVKAVFCLLLFVVVVLAGWWFQISNQQEQLEQYVLKEEALKKEFSEKQAKVVNLAALEEQLKKMKDLLHQLLLQLPSKTEMPELLVDISQAALSAGIQSELFQPGPESIKEFYAEKPIQLRMIGTYHQFGTFISNVASLPRVVILTMHDVALKPNKDSKETKNSSTTSSGQVLLEGTVKTYRYVEEDEMAENAAATPTKPGVPPPPAAKGGK